MRGRTEAGRTASLPLRPGPSPVVESAPWRRSRSRTGLAMNEKLRPSASCCPASPPRGKVGGWVIGGTRRQPPDLRAALEACPRGRCSPGPPPPFTPHGGPLFLRQPQDPRRPTRSSLLPPPRLRDSQAPEPGLGGQLGRQGGRGLAGLRSRPQVTCGKRWL